MRVTLNFWSGRSDITDKARVPVLHRILRAGYFPAELPPSFTTALFATAALDPTASTKFDPKISAKLCRHSLLRAAWVRRSLGLVNPVPFFVLADTIAKGWPHLRAKLKSSSLSRSIPVPAQKGRAFQRRYAFDHLSRLRAKNRSARRHVVWSDIAQFYHSVYTHSVPWALYGKGAAKADQKSKNLGNRLDAALRNCQDKQTIGIPIGPDTSLVIGELVLAGAEESFVATLKRATGFRYVDDYEFALDTASDAEAVLSDLQHALTVFELSLSPKKTRQAPLPSPLEFEWASDLRPQKFRDTVKGQAVDIVAYYDRMAQYVPRFADEPVIKYAVASLGAQHIHKSNFRLFTQLLLQFAAVEPSALRAVLDILRFYASSGYNVDKDALGALLNTIVERHSPLGHGSEVAWALWGLLVFRLPLTTSSQTALKQASDSVVAVLALDCHAEGLAPKISPTDWSMYFTSDALLGEQWLLAYEAAAQGWVPKSHVVKHAAFAYLLASKVQFYRSLSQAPPPPPTTPRRWTVVARKAAVGGGGGAY